METESVITLDIGELRGYQEWVRVPTHGQPPNDRLAWRWQLQNRSWTLNGSPFSEDEVRRLALERLEPT